MTETPSDTGGNEPNGDADTIGENTGKQRVCSDTGPEQELIGKYGIWLSRQSFREMARDMGFHKYDLPCTPCAHDP